LRAERRESGAEKLVAKANLSRGVEHNDERVSQGIMWRASGAGVFSYADEDRAAWSAATKTKNPAVGSTGPFESMQNRDGSIKQIALMLA
jgi:hypothetical protein